MKNPVFFLSLWLCTGPLQADVRVFVQPSQGNALIRYQCTAGEVVRAFALNVTVDQGRILDISDFFVGESRVDAQGYGIFPASFRDHITVSSPGEVLWNVPDYSPLAAAADNPADTLPGLDSAGVTLVFAGLWDPSVPATVPGPNGTLCALELSQAANVSVAANLSRGGILPAYPNAIITPNLAGAYIDPAQADPLVTGVWVSDGAVTIRFRGGELETAPTVDGQWSPTGNTTGEHTEPVGLHDSKFYRVHYP